MIQIKSKWRFHRAGQGGFYSGRIKALNNAHFTFVYDCGSLLGLDTLETEIDRWHRDMVANGDDELDLLVLSHLDADHINRVICLLRNIGRCKLVVLPFLTPIERLYLYLGLETDGSDTGGVDDAYRNFLIDPTDTLNEAAIIGKIIYIRGEENSSENPNKPEPDPTKDFDAPFRIPDINDDFSDDNNPEISATIDALRGTKNNVIFKRDKWSLFIGRCWEFYFYNKLQPANKVSEYRRFVGEKLGINVDKDGFNTQNLTDLLNGGKDLSDVKKAFKKAFKDMNSPGLVVLHGAFRPHVVKFKTKHKNAYRCHFIHVFHRRRLAPYTLLNGDINLNDINYPNYIVERLPHTFVFQVPHHGSKLSWNLNAINNLNAAYMAIHFGWGNKHGHPGSNVIEDIKNHWNWSKRLATQFKRFTYRIKAYF